MPTKPTPASNMRSISLDRWLIARFLVCFAVSDVLQVCFMLYYMEIFDCNIALAVESGPDYSFNSTLKELAIEHPV